MRRGIVKGAHLPEAPLYSVLLVLFLPKQEKYVYKYGKINSNLKSLERYYVNIRTKKGTGGALI